MEFLERLSAHFGFATWELLMLALLFFLVFVVACSVIGFTVRFFLEVL